jgi:hypothetical protein
MLPCAALPNSVAGKPGGPMFDDLARTFVLNVVAAYDDYVGHRDATVVGRDSHLRVAVEAAIALYHFREYVPDAGRAILIVIVAPYDLVVPPRAQ